MRDFVLANNDDLYKIGLNGKNQLAMIQCRNQKNVLSLVLTSHSCTMFSCDIDASGVIHVAAVTANTLTYIRIADSKASTTHLMHLPSNFEINSVAVNAWDKILLNYCVKSREGCACIEYSYVSDGWHGKNIYTTKNNMELLCVRKETGDCFVVENRDGEYTVINAYNPSEVIFSSHLPVTYAQIFLRELIFANGSNIYCGSNELCSGERVYLLDSQSAAVKNNESFKLMAYNGSWHYSGEYSQPNNAREYVFCSAKSNKCIRLSSPFPYINNGAETKNASVVQEVYMQQRTIFALQAELRSMKARIRKLEEELHSLRGSMH